MYANRLHVLLDDEYDFALAIIFHFRSYRILLSFSDHIYWLRVVALHLLLFLKLHVCPLYLVLNVLSVKPMDVSFLLLSCLVFPAACISLVINV